MTSLRRSTSAAAQAAAGIYQTTFTYVRGRLEDARGRGKDSGRSTEEMVLIIAGVTAGVAVAGALAYVVAKYVAKVRGL